MIRKMIKKKNETKEENYIIDNGQEIEDYEDSNNYNQENLKNNISLPKEKNQNIKNPKSSYRSGGDLVKEQKAKYQKEKNKK